MQLLDGTTARITDTGGVSDLSDLVGIAEYIAAALDDQLVEAADAEAALDEWADRPDVLVRAAELTSHPTAASLLRSSARRAPTTVTYRTAS